MVAEKEKVVDNDGARIFHENTKSDIKEFVEYKNAYHEL
jgi:alpha-beta hydrolase superfamily lysophospholipase